MPRQEIPVRCDFSGMRCYFDEMRRLLGILPAGKRAEIRELVEEKLPYPEASVVVCQDEIPAIGAAELVVIRLDPSVAFLEVLAALRAANGEAYRV